MKLMVITSRYPSPDAPYNHMFVHTRSRAYLSQGAEVDVFAPAAEKFAYEFEAVPVDALPADEIIRRMRGYDAILLHLLHPHPRPALDGARIMRAAVRTGTPVIGFLHGIEVQSRFRDRRGDIRISRPASVLAALFHDAYRRRRAKASFRQMAAAANCRFVVPSRWLQRQALEVIGSAISGRVEVIANGIDTRLFAYRAHPAPPHRLLALRPLYHAGKYAVDLALKVMAALPAEYTLDIYGQGPEEARIRAQIVAMGLSPRVSVHNRFVEHRQLPELHAAHGAYLAVTRSDTQGVSMCEAMASGLPVISFRVAAIPEFVEPGKTGLLAEPFDVAEMAGLVRTLEDADYARRITETARSFVDRMNISKTTARELELVERIAAAIAKEP